MKQVSLLLLQPTTMHDRQSSRELFVAVGDGGGRPLSSHHARRPSVHSLINGHVDEQECVCVCVCVCVWSPVKGGIFVKHAIPIAKFSPP
jgi:hypothetical protein